MNHNEDSEFEERLRSLPTAKPPQGLRERILEQATGARRSRVKWKGGLAFALCLLALLALDLGVERVQSARLSRLIGDGRRIGAPASNRGFLIAFGENKTLMMSLLQKEETR